MKKINLTLKHINEVLDLYWNCFLKDPFFIKNFNLEDEKNQYEIRKGLEFCLKNHPQSNIGIIDENELIACIISFDYEESSTYDVFRFHSSLLNMIPEKGKKLYILAIMVKESYRKQGLASAILDYLMMQNSSDYDYFISDISNQEILSMFTNRGYKEERIEEDYYFVCKKNSGLFVDDYMNVIVTYEFYNEFNLFSQSKIVKDVYVIGFEIESKHFYKDEKSQNKIIMAKKILINYDELLVYQKAINLNFFDELMIGNSIVYVLRSKDNYSKVNMFPIWKDIKNYKLLKDDWDIVVDFYSLVACKYEDKSLIIKKSKSVENSCSFLSEILLELDACTQFESGYPTDSVNAIYFPKYKNRIQRFYLGDYKIFLTEENNPKCKIGFSQYVSLFVSIDSNSNIAVCNWYSLSAPFYTSYMLDNNIRNQVMIEIIKKNKLEEKNLYDFLREEFKLYKVGTPKMFVIFPKCDVERRESSTEEQIQKRATLLVGETIKSVCKNFGVIKDEDIIKEAKCNKAQYDRADVYTYTNVVLQYMHDVFRRNVIQRLKDEVITLFYIELIVFEEAAINIMSHNIIHVLEYYSNEEKVKNSSLKAKILSIAEDKNVVFLNKVRKIYDSYSRTSPFWDVQVNYPSSQKSIDMLRNSFQIKKQYEFVKKNREYLQTIFEVRSELSDRNKTNRMNTLLMIISFLAFLSSLIDSSEVINISNEIFGINLDVNYKRISFIIIVLLFFVSVLNIYRLDFLRKKNKK